MTIRPVTLEDDFTAIGDIYVQSWRSAYRGIVPGDYLDSLSSAHWAEALRNGGAESLVVLDGDIYAGTSSVCPAREQAMAGWGELVSIYLRPDYWGRGYAAPLFHAAIAALWEKGFRDIYLWVLEDNRRARGFYEKHGFAPSGDRNVIVISETPIDEVRYVSRAQP